MSARLLYWKKDANPAHGKAAGNLMGTPTPGWPPLGRAEKGPEIGRTRVPMDRNLFARLLAGEITVDVDATTEDSPEFLEQVDVLRQAATLVVTLSEADWESHPRCQPIGDASVYREYGEAFLEEFTARIAHIPLKDQPDLFPHALVFPCSLDVLVGRDGLGLVFRAPSRPETVSVTIDRTQILDALLLPHPAGKDYTFPGPASVATATCDDTSYRYLKGNGGPYPSIWGCPHRVILEYREHMFYEDLVLLRHYPDGEVAKCHLGFAELLGTTDPKEYTVERARKRAQLYAAQWALLAVTPDVKSVKDLQDAVQGLRGMVTQAGTSETELEAHFDKHPWMLERALSCVKYHSQVSVPEEVLSRSDSDIRPDKLLQRHDGYVDVLDLKRADAPLVVQKKNRNHPNAKVTEAEAQVATYQQFLEEPAVRDYLQEKEDLRVLRPRGVLLMGRRPKDLAAWEDVKSRLAVQANTYDDILDELETLVQWVVGIGSKGR